MTSPEPTDAGERALDRRITIDPRYQGFPGIALGGYVAGLLAARLDGTAEVSFRAPPPVSEPLAVERPDSEIVTLGNGEAVAEARITELAIEVPDPVGLPQAEAASASYPGFATHPFPGCFTCGPDREPGDGLRVFPGRVDGTDLVAASWTPDRSLAGPEGSVRAEFAWAALDCPQLWALMMSTIAEPGEHAVTGAMTVRVDSPPRVEEPYVIIAWPIDRDGRSIFAGAAIYTADGDLKATGLQRAVVVPGAGVPLGFGRSGRLPAEGGG